MRLNSAVIFVTGGVGFIGSAVIRHLLEDTQACVVNIDKLTYASNLDGIPQAAKAGRRYHFAQVDICNPFALRRLFEKFQPQFVMNLAAETHVDRSIDDPDQFVQTNVVGTFTLLQEAVRFWRTLALAARCSFRFLHVSTDEVYGSLGCEGRFTENTAYAPNSPYAATKAASDHLVRAWGETYELPTVITNCSNNYGPYQFPEKLVPHMIIRSLAGESLPVYGDGQNVRDWLYVEDHARALTLVLERGSIGGTYNIGSRNERTTLEMVRAICALLDEMRPSTKGPHETLINYVTDRPGHDRRYAIDPSKMERELGWKPVHTFEEGLRETVRWYLDHPDWWQAIMRRGYKAERLGLLQHGWGLRLASPKNGRPPSSMPGRVGWSDMQSAANGCIARPSSTRSARYGPPAERPALGDDMKIYDPEKLASLPSPPNARIRRAAIVAGTLSAAVVLAWLGWNSLHSARAVSSAGFVDQKPASRGPSVGSDRSSTQSASGVEASRQVVQTVALQPKIGTPVSGSSNAAQSTIQAKTSLVLQRKNPSASASVHNRSKTQPTPFPETKPTTIDGWLIREVANGRAVLQGPNGTWKVARGDTVPGLGTVDSIARWGNRWIVSTSRGLISTQ